MSRRVYKKVGTVTPAASDSGSSAETCTIITNHRFLYRGYIHTAYSYSPYNPLGGRWCGRDGIGKNSCEWERC